MMAVANLLGLWRQSHFIHTLKEGFNLYTKVLYFITLSTFGLPLSMWVSLYVFQDLNVHCVKQGY